MTKVKICGIRDLESALVAAEAGADFLGFVFVPGARRRLEEAYARDLIARLQDICLGPRRPILVGLFADQPPEEVNRVADRVGVDMVQLCGNEQMRHCALITRPIIKAIAVREESPPDVTVTLLTTLLDRHNRAGHLCVLDRHSDQESGGTGRTFDWSLLRHLSGSYRFLLAGGLAPENVAQAVAEVAPWGVDVSSGVETDGKKDPAKIHAFVRAVRKADWRHQQGDGLLGRAWRLLRGGPIREERVP